VGAGSRIPVAALRLDRRALSVGILASCASTVLPSLASAADPAGRVEMAKSRATALLDGPARDLREDADLFLQELVQTFAGARLALALGADTRVNLGERTRFRIEQSVVDRGGVLLLERGALLFDRPDSAEHGEAIVRTPFAIIAARGTRFFVGPSNGVVGVFLERGAATVRNNGGRVVLQAGEGADLVSPDVPPTPPHPWGAARIAAALDSVT